MFYLRCWAFSREFFKKIAIYQFSKFLSVPGDLPTYEKPILKILGKIYPDLLNSKGSELQGSNGSKIKWHYLKSNLVFSVYEF